MRTSTPGRGNGPATPGAAPGGPSPPAAPPGFTLVEFAVVLFILGLVVWLSAPRLAAFAGRDRDAVFREIAAGSEAAFDTALFEKREMRLVVDPVAATFRFRPGGDNVVAVETEPPREFGEGLSVTGISVDGESRPPDIVTEIRYQPGGRVPSVLIFLRESAVPGGPRDWTLRINPFDGSVDVVEGHGSAPGSAARPETRGAA